MRIIEKELSLSELKEIALASFGDMVKAVVDIDRGLIAIDAELHSDLEALLLDNGSKQKDLWGINLYPDIEDDDFIEFDSMINMRPSQNNMTRGVDSKEDQKKIINTVNKWIKK